MKLADLLGGPSVLGYTGGCSSCPRKRVGYEEPVLADTQVLWVGATPGPITGAGKEDVAALAARYGVPCEACTNLVHCATGKDPTPKEISCCMAMFVQQEVKEYPIVVLCGSEVVRTFFPKVRTSKLYGNLCAHPDYPGQRFYCLPMKTRRLEDLIARLGRIVQDRSVSFKTYRPSAPEFDARLEECLAAKRLSIDVETNGKEQWDPAFEITSVSLAKCTEWVVACHEEDPAFTGVLQHIAFWLQEPSNIPVGHNLGYDLHAMEMRVPDCVVRCKVQLDTQALAYQARGYTEVSLKELVSKELDGYRNLVPWPSKEKDSMLLTDYNAEDVIYPLQLVEKIMPTMHPDTLDLFIRVAGRQSLLYQRIKSRGVYFRRDVWEENTSWVRGEMARCLAEWQEEDPRFNPTMVSGKALETYLFDILKLETERRTGSGLKMSTDEVTIKSFLPKAPQLKHLLEYRRLEKLRSTYIDPFSAGGLVGTDGRVHPRYVYDTTDTGRRACRQPNYQNPPRKPKSIRAMYGAPEGRLFMQADLSQIELRIAVSLAHSHQAIEKYNAGIDLHAQMAQQMVGEGNPFTKEDRTNAKAVNFAMIYGGSWEQLQQQAYNDYGVRLTDQEAQRLHRLFFQEVVPGLEGWHNRTRRELIAAEGHARQVIGHEHYYSGWDAKGDGHVHRSHLNSKCQGPAAYIMCHIMILVQQRMLEDKVDASVVGDVHDAAHIDMAPDALDQVLEIFNWAVFETQRWIQHWFLVPLVMDYEIGPSWGELKDLDDAA